MTDVAMYYELLKLSAEMYLDIDKSIAELALVGDTAHKTGAMGDVLWVAQICRLLQVSLKQRRVSLVHSIELFTELSQVTWLTLFFFNAGVLMK